MTDLRNTREYKALQKSFETDPSFESWFKASLEGIEETLRDPEEPELDINVLFDIICYLLRDETNSAKN